VIQGKIVFSLHDHKEPVAGTIDLHVSNTRSLYALNDFGPYLFMVFLILFDKGRVIFQIEG